MSIDPRRHVGEQYGIFIIEDVLSADQKDKDGHWIYKAVCQKCGFKKFGTYGDIKRKNIEKCTHVHEYQIKNCLYCNKEIPINDLTPSKYNEKKFCNHSCATSYNNQGVRRNYKDGVDYDSQNECLNCKNTIPRLKKYCSKECQNEYEQSEWEKRWFTGEISGNNDSLWIQPSGRVRTYLFKKYNNKCAECGWGETNPFTGRIPLEIHHKDGNARNTVPDNLTLLCPNCHSLTENYRVANKGNGRGIKLIPKLIEVEI